MTGLGVPSARGVPSVPASILPSHVHDQRFRALRLNLEGGDERVFGVDHHMFGFPLQLQSDSELQWGTPNSLQLTWGKGTKRKPFVQQARARSLDAKRAALPCPLDGAHSADLLGNTAKAGLMQCERICTSA
jgi:hypothetical protein